jgi:hypothetical protein
LALKLPKTKAEKNYEIWKLGAGNKKNMEV